MKISKLLENPTPLSSPDNMGGGQAPHFGRDPEILEDEQIDETSTTAGVVGGGVATDLGMQRRSKGSIFQGVRTSKKFVNSPVTEDPLKDKSMDALSQAKNVISQQRMAELEKWEQDFKNSMSKRLKQKPSFEPVPVSQPGETYSELKYRMSQLEVAVKKQKQVDALAQKLDHIGRLTPAMQSAIDTRLHVRLGPKDNYQTLNRKLDSIIEILNKNLNTYKIARRKPKQMREGGILEGINRNYYDNRDGFAKGPRDTERHELDVPKKQPYLQQWALKINGVVWSKSGKTVIFNSEEAAKKAKSTLLQTRPDLQIGIVTRGGLAEDEKISGRMKMDDYYRLADAIQEKLKQAIQTGDKARIQELNKQRDELDAHVKKHGMMPEGIEEADMNRRDFIKGVGAVAATGATKQAQPNQRQDLGNGFVTSVLEIDGVSFNVVLDTISKTVYMINKKSDGTPIVNKPGTFIVVRKGKLEPRTEVAPNIMNALQKAGLLDTQQGVREGFNGEYDDEAGMADNNLETLRRAVDGIDNVIDSGDNLPEWCQEKIAVAKSMLVTVWDYMKSEEERNDGKEIDEGKIKNAIASAALAGAALGAGNTQAADLGGYNTQYLQGVVSGQVARPMISVDAARQELQARANGKTQTQEPTSNVTPQQGTNQTPNLSAYETRYLQGVVLGKVPRPTVKADDALRELQLRASRTQSDVNTISSRWGSNQPNNANVITSRGVQREGMNDNPKVDLSPNYPNYSKLVGEFIGMRKNRARFLIVSAELKPGVSETEKIFKARTTNTPISIEISKVRNRTVVEGELSEESLLAKELSKQLKMFNKPDDRDLGCKPEDREIITKEQAAHVPTMVNHLESEISSRITKEHPEVIEQFGQQIVQDAITNIAVYNRHMRQVTVRDVNDMITQVIQQLNRHIKMREEKQRLDPSCWDNKKIGNPKTKMKGGVRVNNCVPK